MKRPVDAGAWTGRLTLQRVSRLLGRVLAVDPRAFELLVIRRDDDAAAVAALPALDLVRLAALLTAGLPPLGPASLILRRFAGVLVAEEHLAEPVAQHAHVDG